tara:strand:+ start:584 stop:793 length:210 start_codon:yes stop_codon:yes gene_type:complete
MASIGTTIIGTNNKTIIDNLIDVKNMKKRPPISNKKFLKANETEDETTDKIRVVSVVILESISPVKRCS